MRERELVLNSCPEAPDGVGIGRGTGCTFKMIREALRAVADERKVPSRHWVRHRRQAANERRGILINP